MGHENTMSVLFKVLPWLPRGNQLKTHGKRASSKGVPMDMVKRINPPQFSFYFLPMSFNKI